MEYLTCTVCGLQHKKSNELNHEVTNRHLTARRENYSQQIKQLKKLADKRSHLESDEHENKKKNCKIVKRMKKIQTFAPNLLKLDLLFIIKRFIILE